MRLGQAVVKEGKALIHLYDLDQALTGGLLEPARLNVFYNPYMTLNRDISVLILRAYIDDVAPHSPVNIVEPMTATGVRAVRYALEAGEGVGEVIASDISEKAVSIASVNVKINNVDDKVKVVRREARSLMYELRWENPKPILYVDIDPFGTPAPYILAALSLVGHRGLLGVTATDLAVLEGSKPKASKRRYLVYNIEKIPSSKEVGVRILIGFIARMAAMLDKSVKPVLAYSHRHYARVFLIVERGSRRSDKMLEDNIGCIKFSAQTGYSLMLRWDECLEAQRTIGPLWVGNLFNRDLLNTVLRLAENEYSYMDTINDIINMIRLILEEEPLQYYIHQRIDALASKARTSMPRRDLLLQYIRDKGYSASRTHFSPVGFRTDAPMNQVLEILRLLGQRHFSK
ncbi:MAG: tRNA (guanine(26)-N(2))-dimethyltransferase [Desulfurococcales archaeon]|nr:tRNA (guanine(26)-N(2))-dimethyltransferase [Desulfurococcales archaeon]